MKKKVFIHPTAEVSPKSKIGANTKIWHLSHIRENVSIGRNCNIGRNVYIENGVEIGNNVKVQNNSLLYHYLVIEDGVFIGPNVIFANDRFPRAVNPDGSLKTESDWHAGKTIVKKGASIGARCVILPDLEIGCFAMVGAGSVLTKNVPDFNLFYGNPARFQGYVCLCGRKLNEKFICSCGRKYQLKNNEIHFIKI